MALKSKDTSTYLSDFLVYNISVYMEIRELVKSVHVVRYEYRNSGRTYAGIRINFVMKDGAEVNEGHSKLFSDHNALEIYIGRIDHLPSHFQANEKETANKDMEDIKNFFYKTISNVSFEAPKRGDKTFKTLVLCKEAKKFSDYLS